MNYNSKAQKYGKALVTEEEMIAEAESKSTGGLSRYSDTDTDIIEDVMKIVSTLPFNLSFKFISDLKLKRYIEVKKNTDLMFFLTKSEILVFINDEMHDELDEESRNILIEQEMAKISLDISKDKIKIEKPDISTFKGLVDKWTLDKVNKANHLVDLIRAQKEDKD
jgi:hypothetical protein